LAELERISRLMMEHARGSAWDQVEALELSRKKLLTFDFSQETSSLDIRQCQNRLNEIIALSNQVMALARERQLELNKQLSHLNQGRKANRAYQCFDLSE